jgi:hypothetical protein
MMALRDQGKAAGVSVGKAHPYLVGFLKVGFVVQDSAGRYELGPLRPREVAVPGPHQGGVTADRATRGRDWSEHRGRGMGNLGPCSAEMPSGRRDT